MYLPLVRPVIIWQWLSFFCILTTLYIEGLGSLSWTYCSLWAVSKSYYIRRQGMNHRQTYKSANGCRRRVHSLTGAIPTCSAHRLLNHKHHNMAAWQSATAASATTILSLSVGSKEHPLDEVSQESPRLTIRRCRVQTTREALRKKSAPRHGSDPMICYGWRRCASSFASVLRVVASVYSFLQLPPHY